MIFTTDTVFNTTFLIERPCNTHDVIATLRTAREDGDQVYVRGEHPAVLSHALTHDLSGGPLVSLIFTLCDYLTKSLCLYLLSLCIGKSTRNLKCQIKLFIKKIWKYIYM